MRIAIMQPTYLPWIGYFDLIDQVDQFVFFDNVQMVRRSWGVRNRIKSAQGELFLSVSVSKNKSRNESLYNNASINYDTKWQHNHLKSIVHNYKKAPYFENIYEVLEPLLTTEYVSIGALNSTIIHKLCQGMDLTTPLVSASSLDDLVGKKDELLASICQALSATEYLSPKGSAVYLEAENPGGAIVKHGMELYYHEYEHPVYPQLYGAFIPYMGIIDLLFNVGFGEALNYIRQGRQKAIHYQEYRKIMTTNETN